MACHQLTIPYFEDDPNREVESIEKIIDENGESL